VGLTRSELVRPGRTHPGRRARMIIATPPEPSKRAGRPAKASGR